ncbi:MULTISPECIES: hypothetical protein [unclassified Actinobaculum]|uniref:AMIN-like domain-containing (lipo)protein n=1 Tax=unclassified Actinobaculum TaxID=2609299 RepID=UPI000D5295A5|nr:MULTISPECIES: hypothetical protein [unclassified Actinobaculum]AWE42204.1 hypothetical protein DDD63_04940 [Actinobaculum sp. 313]RTE50768.1 hypothetical protein EKN07_01090 [Actinobaculum sp. 352]
MKRVRHLALCFAVVAGLSACTGSESSSPSTSPQTTPPKSSTSSAQPSTAGTTPVATPSDPDEADDGFVTGMSQSEDYLNVSGTYVPVSSRLGGHDGYDRLVVEYSAGDGDLQWYAQWVDEPISDGKGDRIDMGGATYLQVSVSGVTYPEQADPPSLNPAAVADTTVIQDADVAYPFEGSHLIYIGTDRERSYRITRLSDPDRIVIDIARD